MMIILLIMIILSITSIMLYSARRRLPVEHRLEDSVYVLHVLDCR